jgi:uncharacterized protein YqjF (DUF2071 family)
VATEQRQRIEKAVPTIEDRLKARERPDGWHIMHQSWEKVLFMHWDLPLEAIRPLLPEPLQIDTFDGRAWLTFSPLHIYGVRPVLMPSLPYLSWMHELNVRTYVHYDGVPGVWFFSLDANNFPAVLGARTFFSLPYFEAAIEMQTEKNVIKFDSRRSDQEAIFSASWSVGEEMQKAQPGTLQFFLVERYCLYSADDNNIYRCRIHHQPWPLQTAENFEGFSSSMAEVNGLPEPDTTPILQSAGPVHVEVWPLEQVAKRSSAELGRS